jgi:hypothetical protein
MGHKLRGPGVRKRPPRWGQQLPSSRKSRAHLLLLAAHIPNTLGFTPKKEKKLSTWLTISQVEFLEQKYLTNLLPKRQKENKKKKEKGGIFLVIKSELFTTC